MTKPIYVTQPSLPPLEEFIPYLEKIWESKQLTNNGPFHQQLEEALCDYLGVPYISLFCNGTQALITAIQALKLEGEVITTPYTFVATAHAIVWNKLTPVFVDIEEDGFNIDPAAVEAAITPRTSAILAVHCYGYPCQTEALQKIADKHGIKLIYDAAHAFGVEDEGGSILRHGDLSVLSFHATKVFNTFEGGAIISNDVATKSHIDELKNFGFAQGQAHSFGNNAKMNEVQAAFGLLQLQYIDNNLSTREKINTQYTERLNNITGLHTYESHTATKPNHSYYPITTTSNFPISRDQLHAKLKASNVYSRRYFWPLVTDLPCYTKPDKKTHLPNSRIRADNVLCLPIYPNLSPCEFERILSCLKTVSS